jgi:hypothetical protein
MHEDMSGRHRDKKRWNGWGFARLPLLSTGSSSWHCTFDASMRRTLRTELLPCPIVVPRHSRELLDRAREDPTCSLGQNDRKRAAMSRHARPTGINEIEGP